MFTIRIRKAVQINGDEFIYESGDSIEKKKRKKKGRNVNNL